jgi:hypothetical protein
VQLCVTMLHPAFVIPYGIRYAHRSAPTAADDERMEALYVDSLKAIAAGEQDAGAGEQGQEQAALALAANPEKVRGARAHSGVAVFRVRGRSRGSEVQCGTMSMRAEALPCVYRTLHTCCRP